MFEPKPRRLDYGRTHKAAASPRNSLRARHLATVEGAGRQAQKSSHLPSIIELTIIDFTRHDSRERRPDSIQQHQLTTFFLGRLARRRRFVKLAFDVDKLLLHQRQSFKLPRNLICKPRRQRTPLD
jgi:hypothetical protein